MNNNSFILAEIDLKVSRQFIGFETTSYRVINRNNLLYIEKKCCDLLGHSQWNMIRIDVFVDTLTRYKNFWEDNFDSFKINVNGGYPNKQGDYFISTIGKDYLPDDYQGILSLTLFDRYDDCSSELNYYAPENSIGLDFDSKVSYLKLLKKDNEEDKDKIYKIMLGLLIFFRR
jgi:hypothetical protein